MYFDCLEHLESNGFFTATWLVKAETKGWGLWPDRDGNRNYSRDEDTFVVWIGEDLKTFVADAILAALTQTTIVHNDLIIEPNDGSDTACQVRYKDQDLVVAGEGYRFLGLKCAADSGNFAVFWYTHSFIMMRLAAETGNTEIVSRWDEGRGLRDKIEPGREIYEFKGIDTAWSQIQEED